MSKQNNILGRAADIAAEGGIMRKFALIFSMVACVGSLVDTVTHAETLTYTYDALGRLSGTVIDSTTSIYRFDAADNRRNVTVAVPSSTRRPVFRFWSGGAHFYTAGYLEGNGAGFDSEGVGFTVYPTGGTGKMALYRCYNAPYAIHFLSLDSNCAGYNVESTIGYVASASGPGLQQLYWFHRNGPPQDHLFTVNYSEGANNGYTYIGSMGYVM